MGGEIHGCSVPDPKPKVYINNHEAVDSDGLHFWLMELVSVVKNAGRQDLIAQVNYGKLAKWLETDRSKK